MARKDVLSAMIRESAEQPDSGERAPTDTMKGFGAVGALNSSLSDMRSRSVIDLHPGVIDDAGPRDRLEGDDGQYDELRDSIAKTGQRVPIMVRESLKERGRYDIIYGRRRLKVLKELGQQVKAIIQKATDDELVLWKGQENNVRLDPSFVEKAVFASEMNEMKYHQDVIMETLNVHRTVLAKMRIVIETIPMPILSAIGPAHEIGRDTWYDLCLKLRNAGRAKADQALARAADAIDPSVPTSERFRQFQKSTLAVLTESTNPARGRSTRQLLLPDGKAVGTVSTGPTGISLKIGPKASAEFRDWLDKRAEDVLRRLHEEWQSQEPSDN